MTGAALDHGSGVVIALAGLAWPVLAALVKRTLSGMEEKIGANAKNVAALQARMAAMIGDHSYRTERGFRDMVDRTREEIRELSDKVDRMARARDAEIARLERENGARIKAAERRMAARIACLRGRMIRQDEFRLLSANLNEKVETIYNHLTRTGAES
ncbi:MAG: hypothetical protein ACNS63_10890 [Candidatus Nitrospinota bacterium M3_3B_026]